MQQTDSKEALACAINTTIASFKTGRWDATVFPSPMLDNLIGKYNTPQNNPNHMGDVLTHTAKVMDEILQREAKNHDFSAAKDGASTLLPLMLAAVFHDIGKAGVRAVNPKTGYDQFIGHADKSVEITDTYYGSYLESGLKACDIPEERRSAYISDLIRLHDIKYSKQSKVRKMLDGHPAGFARDLLSLQLGDIMGQSSFNRPFKLEQLLDYATLIKNTGDSEQIMGIEQIISDIKAYYEQCYPC